MTGRVRTGVLISGRGSNMSALIEAARGRDFAAEIALVLSDKPQAAGLEAARAAGVAAEALDTRGLCRQAGVRGGGDGGAHGGGRRTHLPRRLHAHSERRLCRAVARADPQHPSLAAARPQGPSHPRAGARRSARRTRLHGPFRHRPSRRRADRRPGASPRAAGDDADRLAGRVLIEEHRIYPQALDAVARAVRTAGRAIG